MSNIDKPLEADYARVAQIIVANDKAFTKQLEEQKKEMIAACKALQETCADIVRHIDVPRTQEGLYEIYLGPGFKLSGDCSKAIEVYRRLEEIKRGGMVFSALMRALRGEKEPL